MGQTLKAAHVLPMVCLACFILPVLAEENPTLVPYMWREDFETGTVNGWSSYPPFQDTAYDFSLLCGYYREPYSFQGYVASGEFFFPVDLPTHSPTDIQWEDIPDRYYGLRAYRTNSVSPQRIGFTRQLPFYNADTELGFNYWLKQTASPASLLVEFAGGDGKRYQYLIPDMKREQWESVKIPLSSFHCSGSRLNSRISLKAISIMACLDRGDPATIHYFAIDDLYMSCLRKAAFEILNPQTFTYEHWDLAFSQRHFHPGETLSVKAHPEVPVQKVTARLETFAGGILAENLCLSQKGENWVGESLYRFKESDRRGPHKLVLIGETAEGTTVRTDMRLWFLNSIKSKKHPRVLFSQDDLANLKARTQAGKTKPIWENIVRLAKNARSAPVPEDGQIQLLHADYLISDVPPYFSVLRNNSANVYRNALVYAMDGDEEAGQYAKQGLMRMAGWKQWVHPYFRTMGRKSYYPVGIAAMELGLAYDWLQPLLSREEKAAIRDGVLRNGIANSFQEYFIDNQIPTHTSNWISHCTAGPLVALLAFYGELDRPDMENNMEPYFSGLSEKFLIHIQSTLKSDGGYGEGYGYQNFTMSTAWPFLAGLEEVFGVKDLAEQLYFDRAHLYPLYISYGNWKGLLDMGDSGGSRSESSNWAWFAHHFRDPVFTWFYNQAPGDDLGDFLYLDDTMDSQGPDTLPVSRAFPEKGNIVLRTGWEEDDLIFNFRAGPNYNHTHLDQGTFRLWAYNEELVNEAGPSGYYTDPYYWSFIIQSAGHNTILVDGNPESQEIGDFKNETKAFNNHARLERVFLSQPLSLIRAELGMLYRGMLEQFTRTVCFADSRFFVIHDRIRSKSGPHQYQWQLFPPKKEGLSVSGATALYRGDNAWLQVNAILPSQAKLKIQDIPVPMHELGQFPQHPIQPRAILQVTHEKPSENQDFLVVLTPGRKEDSAPVQVKDISQEGSYAVEITSGQEREIFYFAADAPIKGNVTTDGPSAYVGYEGNQLTALAVESAKMLEVDGQSLLHTDTSVTASLQIDKTGETWTIQADTPTTVSLHQFRPGTASVTGNAVIVGKDPMFNKLDVQKGEATLRVTY